MCIRDRYNILEMDVDIDTDLDARRVAEETGIPSVQIHNGGLCHIDADMTSRALKNVNLAGVDLLILENIGNLVCPAEFDTGAHKKACLLYTSILSTPTICRTSRPTGLSPYSMD